MSVELADEGTESVRALIIFPLNEEGKQVRFIFPRLFGQIRLHELLC